MFTDEGISGLGTRKRDGFNEMIGDAMAGSIDLIITKSVSRFARNTVDSLVTIRKLKEKGVEVYFEKENIYSLDGKGELLLTIMSSLAQEESRSISENVTWGQRKRFSDGKVSLPYKQFLGYERGQKKDDPPVVNPDRQSSSDGFTEPSCREKPPVPLRKNSLRTGYRLRRAKKNGALQRSKAFCKTRNIGVRRSSRSVLQRISSLRSRRSMRVKCLSTTLNTATRQSSTRWNGMPCRRKSGGADASEKPTAEKACSAQSSSAETAAAGTVLRLFTRPTKYRTTVWRCNCKYKDRERRCSTPALSEDEIKGRFTAAFNGIITSKEPYIAACLTAKSVLTDNSAIDAEMAELLREMEVVAELTRKCIEENSSVAQDQSEYTARYNGYVDRYERAKARYDSLAAERREKLEKAKAIDRFIHTVESRKGVLSEFDPCLWLDTVENVTVMSDGKMRFHFFDGTEITN